MNRKQHFKKGITTTQNELVIFTQMNFLFSHTIFKLQTDFFLWFNT